MGRRMPADADGKALKLGDRVRVLGVPDLSGMRPSARAESAPVFAHLVGTVKRIFGFDGFAFKDLEPAMQASQNIGPKTYKKSEVTWYTSRRVSWGQGTIAPWCTWGGFSIYRSRDRFGASPRRSDGAR